MTEGSITKERELRIDSLEALLNSNALTPCGGGIHCGSGIPAGEIGNEIGAIFVNSKSNIEIEKAEKLLVKMLSHDFEIMNFIAFIALSKARDKASPETITLLAKFSDDPDKKSIVKEAREKFEIQ